MKRKIISLIICAACLISVLASCGGSTEVCDTCVDADRNAACDVCGTTVVTVVEKVPTEEEEVQTVVSAIPNTSKLGDIISLTVSENAIPTTVKTYPTITSATSNYALVYVITYTETVTEDAENEANNTYKDVYKLYDILNDKEVFSAESNVYTEATAENRTRFEISGIRSPLSVNTLLAFEVVKKSYEPDVDYPEHMVQKTTYAYYTRSGSVISAASEENSCRSYQEKDGLAILLLGDTYYIYDLETEKTVHTVQKDAYIARPHFDAVRANYGFVKMNGKVYVYDLTKWIECVYSYELPSHYTNCDVFYLENGNILVQGFNLLQSSSINYDILLGDNKYDMKYILVDIATKEAKEVEFGYYITSCDTPLNMGLEEFYTTNVKNIIEMQTIVNKLPAKEITVVADNSLGIVTEIKSLLPELTDMEDDSLVLAENRMLVTIKYGEGSTVLKILNEKGEAVATVPSGARFYDGFIMINGKYYDFDMKLAFDPEASEMTVEEQYENYLLLDKDGDTYFWTLGLEAPQLIVDSLNEETEGTTVTQRITIENEYGFVVETVTTTAGDEGPVVTRSYTLFNINGQKVLTSEKSIENVMFNRVQNVFFIYIEDGSIAFAK